ncbi:MAG: hypothetical protein RBT71_10100, partial [Flavobacteriales bacterium]|nr:hypothetical protein [Flavobacteriales bacterium]
MPHLPSLAAIAIVVLAQAPAKAQDSLAVQAWLHAHQAALGLTDRDLREWTVTGSTTDKKGVTYLYIRQRAHGLPVEGAVANFAVRHGQVVHAGHRLQADVHARAPMPAPGLSAEQALRHAAAGLELEPGRVDVVERRTDRDLVLAAGISRDPVPARLIHQVTADGRIALAWDLTVRSANTPNWWHVAVDAHTGAIVRLVDHVTTCHHAPGAFGRPNSAMDDLARAPQGMGGGGEGSGYRVYAFPAESPSHGP